MSKALATKNVAAVLLGLGMILSTFALATPAKADVISDLQAQIQALLAQIAALQGGSSTPSAACFTFTQNLKQGSTGGEVMQVQKFLNSMADTRVAASGAGSPGNETSTFGPATKAAVVKFQEKYAADILTPVGLSRGTGNWLASTRAKANALCASNPNPGPTPGPVTGGNVMIAAGTQPANSLAPQSAASVPFTTFTLTNNGSAAVTVNSVTVQRGGLAQDAVFSGVILLENSMRIGNTKTFNSNHQAVLDANVTLNPGQSRTFTVAGDMNSSLTSYAGQVVSISVVGVNTSATVSGSLPIVGASHTVNSTLTLGSLSMSVAPGDPDTTALNSSTAGKEIGTTNYTAAEVRMQAGSTEDIWLKSVRWNQAGSAAAGDLANVNTVIDGTTYPMTIDSTGKYYTVVFPGNGLKIGKGNIKDMTVKVDIIGGPNRTVRFDLYKAADIYAIGDVYGYAVTPSQSESASVSDGSEFTSGTPFFSGTVIQINTGSVTSVSRAAEVPAQNVVENTANQPLGGFVIDIKGEAISVQQTDFHLGLTGASATPADVTSITLVDEKGVVVAGPVDASDTSARVRFTDTITYPTGRHVYTLKGKYGTDFANGDTLQASTTPSSDWTTIRGVTTGDTISLSSLSAIVTGNIMTDRAADVRVAVAGTPAAQNVVAGLTGFTASNVNFDATQSGEDIKFSSVQFRYTEAMATDVTNCFAYDGATRLNTTAVNPSNTLGTTGNSVGAAKTFTFDTNLTVSKGTVKQIAIKCDIPGSATANDTFAWGVNSSDTVSGTGLSSGQSVSATITTGGNTMTIASAGALTVALDASSPSYAISPAGSSNVTLAVLRFNGTNEDMRLDRVALQLPTATASSSPDYFSQVSLWDGATQVGTAIFAGSRFATSTLSSTVTIPANGFKVITVKGNLNSIGVGQATTTSYFAKVDYDNDDSTGTRAIGQSSGSTINRTSASDTASNGVRAYRSLPTLAKLAVPSSTLINGTMDVYRFSVSANAVNDVSLYQIVANVATSSNSTTNGSTTVSSVKVYAYTDSGFSNPVPGFTDGQIVATVTGLLSGDDNELQLSSILTIPAGSTYYFKINATITGLSGTQSWKGTVSTYLAGDSAEMSLPATRQMNTATNADSDANDDFIWSPNSTSTTPSFNNVDWTNGYGVLGLPGTGTDVVTLSN
ncbi:hypothetical protein HY970_03460 [Candidatus Kaiserbacteria bacterium]|nr:hypothetical protein [Candidatus Kaiserbacteria bacterium]